MNMNLELVNGETYDQPEEDTGTNALWIPGIQDCPEDREVFCDELSRSGIQVSHPDSHYESFDTYPNKPEWIRHKIEVESELIRDQGHTVLIATSFGTHRAPEIINMCPELKSAILLSPPQNTMDASKQVNDTGCKSPTHVMLRPLTWDMDDETFDPFLARHEQQYEHQRNRMRKELRLLKDGPSFIELLAQCRRDIKLLVVQTPSDPWHVGEKFSHSNMKKASMQDTFHYPHVSKPKALCAIVDKWIDGATMPNRNGTVPETLRAKNPGIRSNTAN